MSIATIQTLNKPLHPRVLDTSGNNNHGTAYTGQALEFDGVVDSISHTAMDALEEFTVAAWINVNAISDRQNITGGNDAGAYLSINSAGTGQYDLQWYQGAWLQGGVKLDINVWYRVVYIFKKNGSAGDYNVYINGVEDTTGDFPVEEGGNYTSGIFSKVGSFGGTTRYFDGMMSNYQIWNTSWTQSDVTYDYLNPEKLVLDNPLKSIPMLTYSDLKLWYPMQDGDRGNQSFLLDGASTGLSDELITNGDFSDGTTGWSNTGLSEFSVSNGQATITGVDTGDHIYLNDVTGNADGKRYRMTLDIASFTGTSFGMNHNGANANFDGSGVNGSNARGLTTTGIHTFDFTWTTGYAADPRIFVVNGTLVINSFSLKTINDKNHGTSVFYGDNLYTTSNAASLLNEADATTGFSNVNADTFASQTSVKHTGSARSLHISEEGGTATNGARAYQDLDALSLVDGRTYLLSFYARHVGSGGAWQISHGISGSSASGGVIQALTSSENTFVEYTSTFVHSADTQYFVIQENSGDNDGGVYIDQISIKEVGFAKGWTEADAQTTIPQLGFQSYNQLAWFDGTDDYVDADFDFSEHSNWSISFWEYRNKATGASIGSDTHSFFISESGSNIKLYTSGGSTWSINNNITIGTVAYGQWVHRAVVKSGYNYLGYENGVLISTTADAGEEAILASAKIRFGRRAGSSNPFQGSVTEVSIFDSALTLAKVQELYNDGEALDALTHSSVANLAGYWRNEGSSTWTDLSTNSNDGTPTSITENLILPEGQNGRDTQGFLMNRERVGLNSSTPPSTMYVTAGASNSIVTGTNVTLSAWVKTDGLAREYVIQNVANSTSSTNIALVLNTDTNNFTSAGRISGLLWNGSALAHTNSDEDIDDGLWHHYAFTTTSSAQVLYLDGESVATSSNTFADRSSSDATTIGATATAALGCDGQVDDVAIYNVVLDATQVKRNYKAGKGRHRN